MDPVITRRQKVYLIEELDVCVATIRGGLLILQNSRFYGNDHFVFLLLLAAGIERLMKIILHLHAIETTGSALTERDMRAYSHNLVELCEAVVDRCYTSSYLQRQVARDDLGFIRNNERFTDMLALLSDFAKSDRYIYMDAIADPAMIATPPKDRWENLEVGTMPEGEFVKLVLAGQEADAIYRANRTLIACIERFVRALTRLFVLADLGSMASMLSATVSDFSMLDDEQLGETDYSYRPPGS